MSRRFDWGALGKGGLWVVGLAAVGSAIGLGIWCGRHWSARTAHVVAGLVMGGLVGLLVALTRGRVVWKKIDVKLPFVGSVELEPGAKPATQPFLLEKSQRAVGWKIYVELVGRIATQRVTEGTGTLRGALQSLYELLQNVRRYLGEVPPQAPPASQAGEPVHTLETLTIWIMTEVRQLLATWHHRLLEHEGPPTPDKLPPADSEFAGKAECEAAIAALQNRLLAYATAMAELLEVPRPDSFKLPGATAPASSAPLPAAT